VFQLLLQDVLYMFGMTIYYGKHNFTTTLTKQAVRAAGRCGCT